MYDPQIQGRRHTFGVSGLLYKRNVLMYDRETDSLWSQLLGRAATGSLTGTPLRVLPSVQTTWGRWKKQHPRTLVLSFDTGYRMNYSRDPYARAPLDRRPALVITLNGKTKIYPFSQLKKQVKKTGSPVTDQFAGKTITIGFDAKDKTAHARDASGSLVPSYVAFLANARAFYPDAPRFKAK